MLSFFVTFLTTLAMVNSQCDEAPDRDFEFFSIVDATSNSGSVTSSREGYANAIQKVVTWVEDGGFSAKGSAARANEQYISRCWSQDAKQTDTSTVLAAIRAGGLLTNSEENEATYFAGVVWANQAIWAYRQINESVRRLFIIATQGYPNTNVVSPVDLKFSEAALDNNLVDDCPLEYWPPLAQVGQAIRRSRAGMLVLSNPTLMSQAGRANNFIEYFADAGVTDLVVMKRLENTSQMGENAESGLFQMLCPSWLATTTTTTYPWSEVSFCLDEVKPYIESCMKGEL